ncbi:MAG: flavodoxin family protein [Promethearchaeota archaeon]
MKVLIFNGSPRKKKGITDRISQWFMEGAREAGAETETVYLTEKKINYCKGCFNCWFVTPGKCIQKDDMEEMKSKYAESDIIGFASPVYVDGFTAQFKTLLDRFISGGQPFIEFRDEGHSRHPGRGKGKKKRKLVLISTCGFGEKDNFKPIILHMKAIVKNFTGAEYLGALVRPMGGAMDLIKDEQPEKVKKIKDSFRQAGIEAVSKGIISQELQDAVSESLMSVKEYVSRLNNLFRGIIKENKT